MDSVLTSHHLPVHPKHKKNSPFRTRPSLHFQRVCFPFAISQCERLDRPYSWLMDSLLKRALSLFQFRLIRGRERKTRVVVQGVREQAPHTEAQNPVCGHLSYKPYIRNLVSPGGSPDGRRTPVTSYEKFLDWRHSMDGVSPDNNVGLAAVLCLVGNQCLPNQSTATEVHWE